MITIAFREKEKGWTSFFSYEADHYIRLGNTFFSYKNGELWEHNDKENPVTNTFYGVKYPSKISTVFNDVQTEDKIFKTFVIEGDAPWDVSFKTNLTETSLKNIDFDRRESRYFTHLRGNELEGDFNGNSQGIGVCVSNDKRTLKFDNVGDFVNVGDQLYILDNEQEYLLGGIKSKSSSSVTIDKDIDRFCQGYFFFSVKNTRAEGGEIRGYYAMVEMENKDDKQVELFAINSNISKSYV
ncbi:hypothetical protein HX089_05445 [Myroides odoratimimus]|uniref:hypothetical protein n=1 Tax=Myroides odoratimimus TaxID=76832 RepID=UPI002576E712|nr:hypothetical protein [Myroides odoratimimus]MDM1505407.1 hypothetical protein [Myroides odoratimimus]MDM1515834.1 hypothetical protein [Myroides odoratimimus]